MSDVFFEELEIAPPDLHLDINRGTHAQITGQALIRIEEILLERNPSGLLIYGDTNSTLAAALAAAKLHIPVAHVEAGPRLFDLKIPEEVNRIIADHTSALLFCPDIVSVQNLARENLVAGVHFTGDVMLDAFLRFSELAARKSSIIDRLGLGSTPYALMTAHRPNNTDSAAALARFVELLERSRVPIVWPLHPRTTAALKREGLWDAAHRDNRHRLIPAVGYLDILQLLNHCKILLTDSGGLQKEAYFCRRPTVLLFFVSPWPQILDTGWQTLCWKDDGIDVDLALSALERYPTPHVHPDFFGSGRAASAVVDLLETHGWFGEPQRLAAAGLAAGES